MENASKALIIAASILIAIMIVAMGVTIFNKAQGSGDTTALDTTEINMFNQKFERYDGAQLGSQVKSLLSYAISNASANKEEPAKLPTIYIVGTQESEWAKGDTTAYSNIQNYITLLSNIRSKIISTKQYDVSISYDENSLINQITIK